MKIGKILGSISPAFGLLSGSGLFGSKGFGGLLGSMSPMYGAMSGNGLFGHLMESLLGGHQKEGESQQAPPMAPSADNVGSPAMNAVWNDGQDQLRGDRRINGMMQNQYLTDLMRGLSSLGAR